jgi:hypothetical protein
MATLKELAKVMGGLAILYPRFELKKETIVAYHRILGDLPYEMLNAASLEIGRANTFFPSAAELRKAAMALVERADGVPSAQDAWGEVCRSFGSHGFYRGAPEWSHALVGKAVAAIGGYAELCHSDNPIADRARFIEAYNAYLARDRNDKAMLPEVRRMIELIAAGKYPQLDDGKTQ